jgi:hypothetical protein
MVWGEAWAPGATTPNVVKLHFSTGDGTSWSDISGPSYAFVPAGYQYSLASGAGKIALAMCQVDNYDAEVTEHIRLCILNPYTGVWTSEDIMPVDDPYYDGLQRYTEVPSVAISGDDGTICVAYKEGYKPYGGSSVLTRVRVQAKYPWEDCLFDFNTWDCSDYGQYQNTIIAKEESMTGPSTSDARHYYYPLIAADAHGAWVVAAVIQYGSVTPGAAFQGLATFHGYVGYDENGNFSNYALWETAQDSPNPYDPRYLRGYPLQFFGPAPHSLAASPDGTFMLAWATWTQLGTDIWGNPDTEDFDIAYIKCSEAWQSGGAFSNWTTVQALNLTFGEDGECWDETDIMCMVPYHDAEDDICPTITYADGTWKAAWVHGAMSGLGASYRDLYRASSGDDGDSWSLPSTLTPDGCPEHATTQGWGTSAGSYVLYTTSYNSGPAQLVRSYF